MSDEETIRSHAKAMAISPYELMKRKLNFRKKEKPWEWGCTDCASMVVPTYRNGKEGMQCLRIGVMDDKDAWVGNETRCDAFKRKPG